MASFLVENGFKVIDRNYRKKWGELDIVASKDKVIHFVEVKTVSRPSGHEPEENVHYAKKKRLGRAIQTWLIEKKIGEDVEFQIDVVAVFLDLETGQARIRLTENIILGE